jgi:hypothetical protein
VALPGAEGGPGRPTAHSLDDTIGLLCQAILVDLCNEQCAVLASPWRAGLSSQGMMKGLPLLGQLGAFRLGADAPLAVDSPGGKALCELAARLGMFSASRARLWERLPPLRWLRRAPVLGWLTRHALAAFVGNVFGGADDDRERWRANLEAARRLVRRKREQLRLDYHKARRAGLCEWPTLASHAEALLKQPIAATRLTTDAELLGDGDMLTLSRGQYQRIAAEDGKAHSRRSRLMRAADEASAELHHPKSCHELLGSAAPATPQPPPSPPSAQTR